MTKDAVVGIFEKPDALLKAARGLRDERPDWNVDAHSPHPVHGIEKALGLKESPLGYLVLLAALSGVFIALLLQAISQTKFWFKFDSEANFKPQAYYSISRI